MSVRRNFSCFNLVIHGKGIGEILAFIEQQLSDGRPTWIVTTNPEILLFARSHPWYWETLRAADLRIVDGFGLQLVGWLSRALPKRRSGVAISDRLMHWASDRRFRVGLIGGGSDAAIRSAEIWKTHCPNLEICAVSGGRVDERGFGDETHDADFQTLQKFHPDLILVAFGHPKQEEWIRRHLAELPSVKVILGVGGTFDYWVGASIRSPGWIQSLGLEWLWRLFQDPKARFQRIVDAVIRFPWEWVKWRLK